MDRPWMPLYVADYIADTLDLKTEDHACYMLLLVFAWRSRDGTLPNDMKYLKRALASCVNDMHGNRFNRIVPRLLERFFDLGEDGKFRNKRLTKELEKAKKISEKQKQNAEKRWSRNRNSNDLTDATAMPLQLQSQLQLQKKERKQVPADARADAPADLEKQFFDRAVEVIKGPPNDARKVAGQLRKACENDIAKARSSLELSAGKSHPKSWIMGHISWLKKKSAEPSDDTVLMNNADDRYVLQ